MLTPDERATVIKNIAGHLINAQEFIQKRMVRAFNQVDPEYGSGVQKLLDQLKTERQVGVDLIKSGSEHSW